MLKRQACAKFQSQIFDESEVIQIFKVVRCQVCQVYKIFTFPIISLKLKVAVAIRVLI